MKESDFVSLVNKKYGGLIRIVDMGTDKASEDNHMYLRPLVVVFRTLDNYRNYEHWNLELRPRFNCLIKKVDGIWYLHNSEKALEHISFFVKHVLESLLK